VRGWAIVIALLSFGAAEPLARRLSAPPYASVAPLAANPYLDQDAVGAARPVTSLPHGRRRVLEVSPRLALAPSPYELTPPPLRLAPNPYGAVPPLAPDPYLDQDAVGPALTSTPHELSTRRRSALGASPRLALAPSPYELAPALDLAPNPY